MNTREHFKKQGLSLDWGKHKVVIEVGREKDKIVCSPKAFRYLKRAIEALNDIGYVDPILEGEMIDAQYRDSSPKRSRRYGSVREAQALARQNAAVPYLDEYDVQALSQWPVNPANFHNEVLGRWVEPDRDNDTPVYDNEGNRLRPHKPA